jgi:hypothetical protein
MIRIAINNAARSYTNGRMTKLKEVFGVTDTAEVLDSIQNALES